MAKPDSVAVEMGEVMKEYEVLPQSAAPTAAPPTEHPVVVVVPKDAAVDQPQMDKLNRKSSDDSIGSGKSKNNNKEQKKEEVAETKAKAAKPPSKFTRFFSGPHFIVIPPWYEKVHDARERHGKTVVTTIREPANRGQNTDPDVTVDGVPVGQEVPDFLGTIKRQVITPMDTEKGEKVYGVQEDEIVPLPFDTPKIHEYFVEALSGAYMVAQSTIVMFLAIMVENSDRGWKQGDSYNHSWLPVIKALIICYPLVTLIIMVMLTLELVIKKFMYYRMLSLRVLVDWENKVVFKGVFFWYFVFTWILMNIWALYGVIAFYNRNGSGTVDATSFSCFVVVNLQTIQLLLFYNRLLTTESRLVALNQIFERAPVEAQHLLQFTYICEEIELIEECHEFLKNNWRHFFQRIANMLTCGYAYKHWHKSTVSNMAMFDLVRLRHDASNAANVEAEVQELKRELAAGERAKQGLPPLPEDHSFRHPDAPAATPLEAPEQVKMEPPELTNAHNLAEPVDTTEQPPASKNRTAWCCIPYCGHKMHQLWRRFWWGAYVKVYASIHSLLIACMPSTYSWPYRPDVPYFRFLSAIQLVGMTLCGLIVIFGLKSATSSNGCSKGNKSCDQCTTYIEDYVTSVPQRCDAEFKSTAGAVAVFTAVFNNMTALAGH